VTAEPSKRTLTEALQAAASTLPAGFTVTEKPETYLHADQVGTPVGRRTRRYDSLRMLRRLDGTD
jgi:hypothetical protein